MAWREDAEQGFPPQRHQEPLALRTDILDELSDHLALAAERESEAGAQNDHEIRTRVLTKFGNPMAIARSLWWGAMKETVMKDWIQISINAILCIGIVVFMALFYTQMQSSNTALLNSLEERSAQSKILDPSVEFIFHRGTKDGPLVEGAQISLRGYAFNEEETTITEESDNQGRVAFGPIRAGRYTGSIFDELSGLRTNKEITLYAREDIKTIHIVFPPETPTPLNITLPSDQHFNNDDLRVMVSFRRKWVHGNDEWWEGPTSRATKLHWVMVTAEGIFKIRSYYDSPRVIQLDEKIARVFGNQLEFSKVQIVKSYYPENETEKWFFPSSSRALDHFSNNNRDKSFIHYLSEDPKQTTALNLPKGFQEVYDYHSRKKKNEDHGLLKRFSWFPEHITEKFSDYVIDEAYLVEQSQMKEWNESSLEVIPGIYGNRMSISKNFGQVFSLKNIPTTLPKGYRLILCLTEFNTKLFDLNSTLCAYLDTTPTDYTLEGLPRPFEVEYPAPYLVNDPFWKLSAMTIGEQWNDNAFIDLTDIFQPGKPLNSEHGVLFQWENSSKNILRIDPPETVSSSHRPVWVILKPIDITEDKIDNTVAKNPSE